MPPKRRKRCTKADVDDESVNEMGDLFKELAALQAQTDIDGDPEPAAVELDEEAKAAWVAFYNRHADEQHAFTEGDADLSVAWSKLEGYAARLSLVLHCVRVACGDRVDTFTLDIESVDAGVKLTDWLRYSRVE